MIRYAAFLLLAICTAVVAGFSLLYFILLPPVDRKPSPMPRSAVTLQPKPAPSQTGTENGTPSARIESPPAASPAPEVRPPETPKAPSIVAEPPPKIMETPGAMPIPVAPEPSSPSRPEGQDIVSLPQIPQISPPLPPVRPRDPLPEETKPRDPLPEINMREFRKGSPVFIRIFKRENVLEIWARHEGSYRLLKTYPICTWSGTLGPKQRFADGQAPEGFYSVTKKQLHPTSNYHRAFNLGYPNAYDKQLGRTGSALMVHGACASVGCYAMTDSGIAEIYPIVEAALKGGQKEIQVQVFPFRMTDAALKSMAKNQWYDFWRNLKEGYDSFERTGEPPQAFACRGRYVLDPEQAKKQGCQRIAGW